MTRNAIFVALMACIAALIASAPAAAQTTGTLALSLAPPTIVGGQTSVGTVTLPAAGGTTVISLTSSAPGVAAVPATVTIPGGLSSMTFTVVTNTVAAPATVNVTASAPSISGATAALQVTPPATSTGATAIVDDPGCQVNSLPRNDDGSTTAVNLSSPIDFFGTTYTYFYVNNNGNVTFAEPMATFTPFTITASVPPIIAPFFADVDTRGSGSSVVTYSFGPTTFSGRPAMCVDWINVGYYNQHYDKLNSFQLLLVDRSDVQSGDFDIVMNYDRIVWETGDASGGVNGFGGTSAGAGYSAGTGNPAQFYQFPGSLVNGALLDTNANTGLTQTSTNSLVLGRHIFEVRNGAAPAGGGIGGIVTDASGDRLSGAPVQACRVSDGVCVYLTQTSTEGQYEATGLAPGSYSLTVFPPPGSSLNTATVTPIAVTANTEQTVNVVLTGPTPPPSSVTLAPSRGNEGGIPVIFWGNPIALTNTACAGGTASYVMTGADGSMFASGPMTEAPPGTYTATIPVLAPLHHGAAKISITTTCPDGTTSSIVFSVYVDPSGLVRTVAGDPIPGALVTLYRADSAGGPFTPVPEGSAVMSPMNRNNPDLTDSIGHFGWDVISGFYQVRAQADGCTSPTGDPYVETGVLTVPPAIANIDLRLSCPTVAPPPPPTPPSCALTAVINGPPKQLQITVQDTSSGLQSIQVTEANNATVTLPVFTPGSTGALVVVATKVDQSSGAQVALHLTDVNGLTTDCDPVVPGETIVSAPSEGTGGCNVGHGPGTEGLSGLLGTLVGLASLRRRQRAAKRKDDSSTNVSV